MIPASEWRGPAGPIWALVFGVPEEKARKRRLLMLRAFIDDCGTGGKKKDPVFVLAGYIAPAEKWAAFSVDWQSWLDHYQLPRFKMSEAAHRWLKRGEIEPIERFYRVIETYASAEVRFVVPYEAYERAIARLPVKFEKQANVYLLAFIHILNFVAIQRKQLGLEGRIDFIFDKGTFPKDVIDRDWDLILLVATEDAREMLGSGPMWRSDDEELPLQAADFTAWWTLRHWRDNLAAPPEWRYPWEKRRKMPGFEAAWDEENLYTYLSEVIAALQKAGKIPP